ncbi:MAG TPA: tetratricopeptide repeat protein [Vicinamibacteria bacterium]|nr:tetratricopeptide repeat protein [Vicinamibacteria bacterium]
MQNPIDTSSRWSRWVLWSFFLLVLNASYLAAFAEPNLFYMTNVLLHVGLSLVLMAAAVPLVVWWFRSRTTAARGWWAAVAILSACAATGLYLIAVGNLSPMRPVLVAHVAAGVIGVAIVAATLGRKSLIYLAAGAFVFPFAASLLDHVEERSVNRALAPVTMEGEAVGGATGPFFPSSARTTDGKVVPASKFFMESETCGKSGCHADIYAQWNPSAHHFASFNNQWYRKSIEYMQSVAGVTASKWCGGCHDHALLFTGLMDRPIEEVIDTPEARVGLGCVSCHAIVDVDDTMGNGGFTIEYPPLHDLATSDNVLIQAVHDFLVRIDPEPHRRTFLKPVHLGESSAFCSSCHKVHLDVPVNSYRWIRGFNEYDNWQASGVSGEGARSFYYPKEPMTCKECHMPAVPSNDPGNDGGTVRSHRFATANTALPVANRDEEQLQAVVDFLKAAQVTVDLFALVRGGEPPEELQGAASADARRVATTFAVGEESEMAAPQRLAAPTLDEEIVAPLDREGVALVPGESVRIDAVVRTRNVGHFFPGGTVDAFDVWLELQALDDEGKVLFWNGFAERDGKGPVEPNAHFYRSFLLDGKGNPINKRNAWAARSVLYVSLIPPGAANTVRFRLNVPEDVGSRVTLKAKLNYRKFAWWNTQWAYAGVRDPSQGEFDLSKDHDDGYWVFSGDTSMVSGELKEIPDIPIVTMAESDVTLPVREAAGDLPQSSPAEPRVEALRWNDYGIGLLLQGDLRGAERAFLNVTEIDPSYADGFVNVARVRVQEGDPQGAQEMLAKAFELAPDLAKAHYFYGLTLKTEGRYDEALDHFVSASNSYPRDRVVRNQIGRIHFLKREFAEAVAELEKTLTIDPEDLEAHYNLMLSYQGLGNEEKAELHRELYLRFKADEASQFITGDYRRLHPADNNERLAIHEHRNSYVGEMPLPTQSATSGGAR